jgi:hypothetical protein
VHGFGGLVDGHSLAGLRIDVTIPTAEIAILDLESLHFHHDTTQVRPGDTGPEMELTHPLKVRMCHPPCFKESHIIGRERGRY